MLEKSGLCGCLEMPIYISRMNGQTNKTSAFSKPPPSGLAFMASISAPRAPKAGVVPAIKKPLHPGVQRILDDLVINKPLPPGVREILDGILVRPKVSPAFNKPIGVGPSAFLESLLCNPCTPTSAPPVTKDLSALNSPDGDESLDDLDSDFDEAEEEQGDEAYSLDPDHEFYEEVDVETQIEACSDDEEDPQNETYGGEFCDEYDDEETRETKSQKKDRIRLARQALSWTSYLQYGRYFRCRCRISCSDRIPLGAAYNLLYDFWFDQPREKVRRERLHTIMKEAWNSHSQKYRFKIDGKHVCEATFRAAMGFSYQTSMWKRQKHFVAAGGFLRPREVTYRKDSYTKKFDAMKRWIRHYTAKTCDRLPVNDLNDGVLYVVPFLTAKEFAVEYFASNKRATGSKKTFERAFKSCDHVRTMRCKGNFSTCGICIMATKMLSNVHRKRRLSDFEKEVSTI